MATLQVRVAQEACRLKGVGYAPAFPDGLYTWHHLPAVYSG